MNPELDKAVAHYKTIGSFVQKFVTSKEKELALQKVLDLVSEQLVIAPASTRQEYHGAFPGGLIEHLTKTLKNLNTLNNSFELGLSREEMVVAGIFHDIGKVGTRSEPYYIPKNSEWHSSKGIHYEINPFFHSMKVSQLSLALLQENGVKLSSDEFFAIYNFDQPDSSLPLGREPALGFALRQAVGMACFQGRGKSKITL